MIRSIALEEVTFEEYNILCDLNNAPRAERPWAKVGHSSHTRGLNFHAIINDKRQDPSRFRLRFQNLIDLVGYMENSPLFVACVHPYGKWSITDSERRTEREQGYIEHLQELEDVKEIIVRIGRKDAKVSDLPDGSYRVRNYRGDVFSFKNNGTVLVLQRLSINQVNFDMYDFGTYNGYLRQQRTPFVRALYIN